MYYMEGCGMSKITVVQINTFQHKAIGSIMINIHQALINFGCNFYVIWGCGRKPKTDREFSTHV